MTWVLVGVAILLATAAVLATAFQPMVFAMGALNAAMRRAGNIPVSLTFVTGVLVRFGQGLGDFLTRRITGWSWLAQGSPWGRADQRRDDRQRGLHADRRSGYLGPDHRSRPPWGVVRDRAATGLTIGRSGACLSSHGSGNLRHLTKGHP